jgi:galactose mutarotase-like enzyme
MMTTNEVAMTILGCGVDGVTTTAGSVEEGRFRGERAVVVTAGELSATFLPDLGMTGVSLRHRGREHLALPGGVPALQAAASLGLPLLAPWANRLGSRRYRAAGVDVDLTGLSLGTDANGLPIHGLLLGHPGWRLDRRSAGRGRAGFRASIDVDAPAFPFPHRVELTVSAHHHGLAIDTTVIPTGRRRVPVAFGWHPYLRLPGTPRRRWTLQLPARAHLSLDELGLPTGGEHAEPRESEPIGRRTFDDLYRLGRECRLALVGDDDASITLRCGRGYPYAQVWVPAGKPFAALEPMAAATNSLVDGTAPLVEPGDAFTASFSLEVGEPGGSCS